METLRPRAAGAALVALVLTGGVTPCAAQTMASDADRREALGHFRLGTQAARRPNAGIQAVEAFQQAGALLPSPVRGDAYDGMGQGHMGVQRYASAIRARG